MKIYQSGPISVVVEVGDTDPPSPTEFDVSFRVDAEAFGGELAITPEIIQSAEDAYRAMARIEDRVKHYIGPVAPQIREAIRNQLIDHFPWMRQRLNAAITDATLGNAEPKKAPKKKRG